MDTWHCSFHFEIPFPLIQTALPEPLSREAASTHFCCCTFRACWESSTDAGTQFKNTPNGLPGVCTRTPLLWSEGVLKGRISRQRFVELNSSNAAKLYGMYPKKGTIQPGSDADFVIFRSETARKPLAIRQEDLHHGADYTPYEGMQVQDWPRLVILRGKVAYDGATNTVMCEKGSGQFIKRGLSSLP